MIKVTSVLPSMLFPFSRVVLGLLLLLSCAAHAANVPAQELLDGGRVDEALRLLTPQAAGNNAAAFNYLGRVYYSLEDWDNAVRNCERAAQLEPRNAEFQLWLGRSYGEKANSAGPLSAYSLARKSVAAFAAAHNLDRKNLDISRDLAEYYFTAPSVVGGGSDKAMALAAELVLEHPSDAAWVRAMVDYHDGRYDQAEHEFEESIRLGHDSAGAYLEFARYLRGRKQWDRFQGAVQNAIKSTHVRPADRYDAAELLLVSKRNLPEAEQQMRAYIQSGHTEEKAPLFRAHLLLGDALVAAGDSTQAAAEYRAALALASSYRPASDALRRLGRR
jgi:tetratricopeptide (TPR) repeat protein